MILSDVGTRAAQRRLQCRPVARAVKEVRDGESSVPAMARRLALGAADRSTRRTQRQRPEEFHRTRWGGTMKR
jgi:hypothetical protein